MTRRDQTTQSQTEGTDAPQDRLVDALTLVGPLAGTLVAVCLTVRSGSAVETAAITFLALLLASIVAERRARWADLLPLMGAVVRLWSPFVGFVALVVLDRLLGLPGLGIGGAALVSAGAGIAMLAAELPTRRHADPQREIRIGVIGSSHAADMLARELEGGGKRLHRVLGRIDPGEMDTPDPGLGGEVVPTLGTLQDVGRAVAEHRINLLLMTTEVPRLQTFDEIARTCLHLPVRLQELAGFYEDTFGHVPVAEINAAWFQYLMHPRFKAASPSTQRLLDVVVAGAALVVAAPVLAVFGLLIRRDGGPALFRQQRIGEAGQAFTILKLRTMREGASSTWAQADDDRVTPVGRFLRRTHVDELPQLWNVLRGDMSLVGPRPEQLGFVDRLELSIPFYSRRHLVKPGLTGWAQVRCGYAGSEVGSAWKVAHDLFYLKHRSLGLNLMILGETVRTLVADRQYTAEPQTVAFILGADPVTAELAVPAPPTVADADADVDGSLDGSVLVDA